MSKDRRLGRGLANLLGTPIDEPYTPAQAPNPQTAANSPVPPVTANLSAASGPEENDLGRADMIRALNGQAHAVASQLRQEHDAGSMAPSRAVVEIALDQIDNNPFQPRREFNEEEIASLAESLKEHEQLQPVMVRRVGNRYQLISGERRLRAATRAGWSKIRAEIRVADDRLVAELAIIENLQRKDLNPIEKALSFKRYLSEHKCTQDDLAKRLKIDRSTIANMMRLLELPETILDAVQKDEISAGHARSLLPLADESQQLAFARKIRAEGWSVRETERQVAESVQREDNEESGVIGIASHNSKRTKNPQTASLEQELKLTLGTKVEIKQSPRGSGKIVISFANPEEFERIRQSLSNASGSRNRKAG